MAADQEQKAEGKTSATPSRYGAFSHIQFCVILVATTISLTGLAMSDTASSWLMTNLNADPRMISMVQVAISLPMFLFTFVAGAIADIVEPRRFLIALECFISVLILVFAFMVFKDWVTANYLLLTTFLLASCWSLAAPAWLSVTPLLVPPHDLDSANAANNVGYNVSRAIGPPLAGFALSRIGSSAPYWIFGLANLVSVSALIWWRPPRRIRLSETPEHLFAALRTGLAHAAKNKDLRATLIRTIAVYPFACAYTALLPLIAREHATVGSEFYGILLATIGVGAIFGSFGLSLLRKRLGPDAVVAAGTVGLAAALALFSIAQSETLTILAALIGGASWTVVLVGLYVSALLCLDDWMRGRGLAILLTVIFACVTCGSMLWGQIASNNGLSTALLAASICALLMIPASWRWKLRSA